MTSNEIDLVQASFEKVRPISLAVDEASGRVAAK